MAHEIPIVDISDFPNRYEAIAQDIFRACTTIGFFYVVNHTVPQEQIAEAFSLSKEFYDRPYEEKDIYGSQRNRGYVGLYGQKLDPKTQKRGDHKEAFNFGPIRHGESCQPLPPVFEKGKEKIETFWRSCDSTAQIVLEALAIALKIPEEEGGRDWFKRCHRYDAEETKDFTLRFLKYPRGAQAEHKEKVRTGAHTDFGSITLLFQKGVPGLEVQASRTDWIAAPLIENAILVNVGGVFEFWTNGLFKSTMHRVVFKPEHQEMDRYSIACFFQPAGNTLLRPIPSTLVPKSRPQFDEVPEGTKDELTAMEYLQLRLEATYAHMSAETRSANVVY
ncbi:hypothetical protein BCR43DRAFT_557585 [Syncephalastrum racemosum]|uniref:Fe2OG dioxygenase domain-containing protein n=1 Tax=Syncephalastrum racemosum TaxID=13706 RepID=A0A1X2H9S2_SYNRA|nr:hypothetical protein BCR43DRAFT_557585 [Syncephalastrum racemosum]